MDLNIFWKNSKWNNAIPVINETSQVRLTVQCTLSGTVSFEKDNNINIRLIKMKKNEVLILFKAIEEAIKE